MFSTATRRTVGIIAAALLISACSSSRSGGSAETSTADSGSTTTSVVEDSSTSSTTVTTLPSTTPPATPTTPAPPPPGAVPGTPTVTYVGSGGGSGELAVNWNAVANATGYKVVRGPTASGPWTVTADVNIVNGTLVELSGDVINLYGNHQNFFPGAYTSSGTSTTFSYVELTSSGDRYFKVRAYNASGYGAFSSVHCANLYGMPAC